MIHDGQRVCVVVTATYNVLKSDVLYRLEQEGMEADASTLAHETCNYE